MGNSCRRTVIKNQRKIKIFKIIHKIQGQISDATVGYNRINEPLLTDIH